MALMDAFDWRKTLDLLVDKQFLGDDVVKLEIEVIQEKFVQATITYRDGGRTTVI
jgi:hypothetical protein